jgi:hypothetical protein
LKSQLKPQGCPCMNLKGISSSLSLQFCTWGQLIKQTASWTTTFIQQLYGTFVLSYPWTDKKSNFPRFPKLSKIELCLLFPLSHSPA